MIKSSFVMILLTVLTMCYGERPSRPGTDTFRERPFDYPRGLAPGSRHTLRQLEQELSTETDEADSSYVAVLEKSSNGPLGGPSNDPSSGPSSHRQKTRHGFKQVVDIESMSENDLTEYTEKAIHLLNEAIATNHIGNFWMAATDIGRVLKMRARREGMKGDEAVTTMEDDLDVESDVEKRRLQYGMMGPGMMMGHRHGMGHGYGMGMGMMGPFGMMGPGMGMFDRGMFGMGHHIPRLF